MNAPAKQDQLTIEGATAEPPQPGEAPHMIARVSALAVKIVFPFIAKDDIRYYLCGVNLRPLDDGSVMVVATDGKRFVVVRDPEGFAQESLVVRVSKDGLKHAGAAKHTFDVMSNGQTMISGDVAQQLFVQPGNSLIEAQGFPRIENVASAVGYREGITGAVQSEYLAEALEIGTQFGSIRFFTRDANSPLCFVCGGVGNMECFGGIMKYTDSFESLPAWFPRPTIPTTLGDI
jgi:hypothetical protein